MEKVDDALQSLLTYVRVSMQMCLTYIKPSYMHVCVCVCVRVSAYTYSRPANTMHAHCLLPT